MIEKVSPQLVQESFRAFEFFELFYFLTRRIKIIMTFLVRDTFVFVVELQLKFPS